MPQKTLTVTAETYSKLNNVTSSFNRKSTVKVTADDFNEEVSMEATLASVWNSILIKREKNDQNLINICLNYGI